MVPKGLNQSDVIYERCVPLDDGQLVTEAKDNIGLGKLTQNMDMLKQMLSHQTNIFRFLLYTGDEVNNEIIFLLESSFLGSRQRFPTFDFSHLLLCRFFTESLSHIIILDVLHEVGKLAHFQ